MKTKKIPFAFELAFSFLALLVLSSLQGCSGLPRTSSKGTLLTHGKIWTGNEQQPWADSVFVVDGKIAAIGEKENVAKITSKIEVRTMDLKGRTVLPGFIDSHVHILSGGLSLDRLDLSSARSRKETLQMIAEFAKKHPENPWILGRGWSYNYWKPGFPTRQELDNVAPDRPVYLRSYDGHSAWANSKALEQAKISFKMPDPKGGKIVRENGSQNQHFGEPQGTLLEEAMDLVSAVVPKPSESVRKAAIEKALAHAAKKGVTTLCEVGDSFENLDLYEKMDLEKKLSVRVVFGPSIDEGIDAYSLRHKNLLAKLNRESMLWPGPLKGFVDGVVESNTAGLIDDYADGSGKGAPLHLPLEKIKQQLRAADQLNLDVAYHAIGDQSVRNVLDAIEDIQKNGPVRQRRNRIEHIEVIDPKDLSRFAKLGVVASVMPAHADPGEEPNDGIWSKKVGKKRLLHSFAFHSLSEAHAPLAFGSDWPVAPIDPLSAVAIAVTRQGFTGKPANGWIPEQKISLETALQSYTSGSAYALRLEKITGVLKPEMAADMVILSQNADLEDPHSLFKSEVDMTFAAGKIVYQRNSKD